jgi:putative lipoprotein
MGVVLAFALSLHAPPKLSVAPDKVKHFFLSAFVESVSYSTLRAAGVQHDGALVTASAATLSVGIGKEVWDSRHGGRFSVGDLVWNVAGGAAAAAMLEHSRR